MVGSRSVLLAVVLALSCVRGQDSTLKLLAKSIERCGRWSELGTCLKLRALGMIDKAISAGPIVIDDYLSLAPEEGSQLQDSPLPSEAEIVANLPADSDAKDQALDDMIVDRVERFIKSRSIKLSLFQEDDDSNNVQQGRKKDKGGKKGYGMMMMMMGAMMVKIALAKLALLAGKALIVSKMALMLSGIIGLKKLVSSGGHSETQVVYATGGHESGGGNGDWGRAAHDIAYSSHAP